MKRLTELWTILAMEMAEWCDVSATRDVKTVLSRCEHEGMSFLTITLPDFAADFERSLELGRVDPTLFTGFQRRGGLPLFLGGFLDLVFDRRTSILLDAPSADAVFAIRELTLVFKKIEGDCSARRQRAALDAFIHCEDELKEIDSDLDSRADRLDDLARLFAIVFGNVVDEVSQEIETFSLTPKHGPGATADKKRGNQKFVQAEWPERLETVFPFGEYVLPRWGYYDEFQPKFIPPGDERPVKVTLVPKTHKTPRVIAIEPTAMQYSQQALLASLKPKLESNQLKLVGIVDQAPNRRLARKGSIDGSLATLDLSEASDRVLNSVVMRLTRPWPSFSEAVQSSRSRRAILPDGRSVRLAKFASMGSALCFPMEEMVFAAIVLQGMQDTEGSRWGLSRIQREATNVRIYGDDIIVPVVYVESVIAALESYGLKVNTRKSFWTGKFRESCGGDYYDGEDVTPVRCRRPFPTDRRDVAESVSWVSLSNQLYLRGLWKSARFVADALEEVLGPLPVVENTSQALGLHSFQGSIPEKMCPDLHKPLVKAWVPSAQIPANGIDGVWALRKTLTGDFSDPSDARHLSHSGRPVASHMKRRWVSVA